jgi:hypothetical protein
MPEKTQAFRAKAAKKKGTTMQLKATDVHAAAGQSTHKAKKLGSRALPEVGFEDRSVSPRARAHGEEPEAATAGAGQQQHVPPQDAPGRGRRRLSQGRNAQAHHGPRGRVAPEGEQEAHEGGPEESAVARARPEARLIRAASTSSPIRVGPGPLAQPPASGAGALPHGVKQRQAPSPSGSSRAQSPPAPHTASSRQGAP